jgi:pilus assembly protein CpaB
MRAGSFAMLILAVLFGSGAVFVTKLWMDNQRLLVTPAEAGLPPTTTVVVAATSLRFGDQLQNDNLREIPWPNGNVPSGGFETREQILAEGERFVITAIEANEPVLSWKITGPGQRASLSAVVEAGMKAVTIRVNDVLGVAGFVLPGDRVDILLTRSGRRADDDSETSYVDVLLQGVKVLAIDQLADERSDDPQVAKAVTLEVDTEQAQKLTLAANVGQLSLALRNIAQGEAEITRRVTISDLNAGTDSALPEPEPAEDEADPMVIPEPEIVYVTPPRPAFATVGVIRQMERSEYQVPYGRYRGQYQQDHAPN